MRNRHRKKCYTRSKESQSLDLHIDLKIEHIGNGMFYIGDLQNIINNGRRNKKLKQRHRYVYNCCYCGKFYMFDNYKKEFKCEDIKCNNILTRFLRRLKFKLKETIKTMETIQENYKNFTEDRLLYYLAIENTNEK